MRIVFFTKRGFQSRELFLYMFSRVAHHFPDVHVVAVTPQETKLSTCSSLLSRYWRKMRRLGVLDTLEILSSFPLQMFCASRDNAKTRSLLQHLPRPPVTVDGRRVALVRTVNGP